MCIAILKPKDKTISKETLKTCFDNNKDGCGFAYCDKGTVMMCKYMKFEDFYNDYIKFENKKINMPIEVSRVCYCELDITDFENSKFGVLWSWVISLPPSITGKFNLRTIKK